MKDAEYRKWLDSVQKIAEDETGRALMRLATRVALWDREVFGGGDLAATAKKLVEESQELVEQPDSLDEAADILIVLLAWCGIVGTPVAHLIAAAIRKQAINEARRWEIGPDGIRRHVE